MTKRGFMQTLFGGAVISLPEVKKVEVLRLEAKDTIVCTCDLHLSQQSAELIRANLQKKFPNNEVVVLGGGLKLEVLKG